MSPLRDKVIHLMVLFFTADLHLHFFVEKTVLLRNYFKSFRIDLIEPIQ